MSRPRLSYWCKQVLKSSSLCFLNYAISVSLVYLKSLINNTYRDAQKKNTTKNLIYSAKSNVQKEIYPNKENTRAFSILLRTFCNAVLEWIGWPTYIFSFELYVFNKFYSKPTLLQQGRGQGVNFIVRTLDSEINYLFEADLCCRSLLWLHLELIRLKFK